MDHAKIRQWKLLKLAKARERRRLARLHQLRRLAEDMPEIAADDVRIRGPQKFALEAPWHDDLVRFLTELRSAAAAQKRAVLDFRPTTQCVAGGTLLFFFRTPTSQGYLSNDTALLHPIEGGFS